MDLNETIEKKKRELEDLIKEKEEYDKANATMTEVQAFAVWLHGTLCTLNHTDCCSWHYEIDKKKHEWNRSAHEQWLRYAERLLEVTPDIELIKSIFKVSRI